MVDKPLEQSMYHWLCEFLGVLFICVIVQAKQTDASSDAISKGFYLACSAGLVVGVAHYNFPTNQFNPWLVIHKFVYELCHGQMSFTQTIISLFHAAWLITIGILASAVATLITKQRTGDWNRTGLPVTDPNVSDHSIMFDQFIGSFIFAMVYHWQMLRTEECEQHRKAALKAISSRPTNNNDLAQQDKEKQRKLTNAHQLQRHLDNTVHAVAIGVGFWLAVSYSFSVSGGNINIYTSAVPSWVSGEAHGIAQNVYGQMLGTAASSVFILIACLFRKKFKFAEATTSAH